MDAKRSLPLLLLLFISLPAFAQPAGYDRKETWPATMLAARASRPADAAGRWAQIGRDFPKECDWALQDGLDFPGWLAAAGTEIEQKMIARALGELGPAVFAGVPANRAELQAELARLAGTPGTDRRWLDLYVRVCEQRRAARLKPLLAKWRTFVFAKHFNMGGSHYAYTEAQSDAQAERNFFPGAALCLLQMNGTEGKVTTLLEDRGGVIRNPDVSFDGRRILFAWKKSLDGDDYHLYEMDAASRQVRQVTQGKGVADYEGIYLPSGDLLFSSTRCVQIVDCWWTEVSNLYTCDANGGLLRRLGFDQVHTNFPALLPDGRITYTRWDYNDRGQIFPQGLFQMNPDGTGQTEFYGNNSWFPTTIIHARGIPGSHKVAAIATGHHSRQAGKLILIDPEKGREENAGVQLIAPVRPTPADRIDAYGQQGDLFQYPYPLSEREFVVTYCPTGWQPGHWANSTHFGIYWMDADGRRELLAYDPDSSCNQAIPLAPRAPVPLPGGGVNYRKATGTYYVQDIYAGPGLAGVPRGAVKSLRVVSLRYRAAGIGSNSNHGPAGGALISTPVAIGQGTWDVKAVLGEAKVYDDGSAFFQVPARTPVYFQALDEKGRALQTMRSWSTLQPGENAACVGCHESKNIGPLPAGRMTLAMQAGPQPLKPFTGPARGFSFAREIQPILDRKCVSCHHNRQAALQASGGPAGEDLDVAKARFLSPLETEWRYTTDDPGTGWEKPGFDDSRWATGRGGFGQPGTPGGKVNTLWRTPDIWIRTSFTAKEPAAGRQLVFWMSHDEDAEVYVNGVMGMCAQWFITKMQAFPVDPKAVAAIRPGRNVLAVHCRQTAGGQFIDVSLADPAPGGTPAPVKTPAAGAFSLLAEGREDPAAKRLWSDAYLALTGATADATGKFTGRPTPLVSWVTTQSEPSMLKPNSAGSVCSRLYSILDAGHQGVTLTRDELDKIACWIDLGVPFCGDYGEANLWTPPEVEKYARYQAKRDRLADEERQGIAQFLSERGGHAAAVVPAAALTPAKDAVTIEVRSVDGTVLARGAGRLEVERTYAAGDTIVITGPPHLAVQLDASLPPAILYAPEGLLVYPLPAGRKPAPEGLSYPPELLKAAKHAITARPATAAELAAPRNLALNPYDVRGDSTFFPHASSNSECRGESVFAARNAIDGQCRNTGHGAWPYQSWGPDKRNDLWWKVEFGRPVAVENLAITIRADFPHDTHWHSAVVEFSDGSREKIALQKTAARQEFAFKKRTVTWVRLVELVQPEPLGWAAWSEVEVWGREPR